MKDPSTTIEKPPEETVPYKNRCRNIEQGEKL